MALATAATMITSAVVPTTGQKLAFSRPQPRPMQPKMSSGAARAMRSAAKVLGSISPAGMGGGVMAGAAESPTNSVYSARVCQSSVPAYLALV